MELSLSEIISSIGESGQTAGYALEDRAVELYFKGGYEEKGEQFVPITKKVSLPNTLDRESGSGEYVDLSLSFSPDNTPEGMARLNQENVKLL